MDDIDRPMRCLQTGEETQLRFSARKPWIRFWGLEAEDLKPGKEILTALEALEHIELGVEALAEIHEQQDRWIREQILLGERIVYDIDCFGLATTEERAVLFPSTGRSSITPTGWWQRNTLMAAWPLRRGNHTGAIHAACTSRLRT